jgi:hypothetical protein
LKVGTRFWTGGLHSKKGNVKFKYVQIRIIEFGWYIICNKSIFIADGHKERKNKYHLYKSG